MTSRSLALPDLIAGLPSHLFPSAHVLKGPLPASFFVLFPGLELLTAPAFSTGAFFIGLCVRLWACAYAGASIISNSKETARLSRDAEQCACIG